MINWVGKSCLFIWSWFDMDDIMKTWIFNRLWIMSLMIYHLSTLKKSTLILLNALIDKFILPKRNITRSDHWIISRYSFLLMTLFDELRNNLFLFLWYFCSLLYHQIATETQFRRYFFCSTLHILFFLLISIN